MAIRAAQSCLDLIGNTPAVRLTRIEEGGRAQIWGKLESRNPGGSLKDRICRNMIEDAERQGRLKPGGTIVEPTSGNTGIGLALVCAAKGYRLILTMPDTMSAERRGLLLAYGAELVLTEDTRGMHGAVRKAQEIVAENPDFFMPQQFSNPANPEAHVHSTAVELFGQFERIDAFVAGVGTGGTITGVGSVFRRERPATKIYAVEPASSPVLAGGDPGFHHIEGIGAGFVPDILDARCYDAVLAVSDEEAREYTRRLARVEGVLAGISSGANVCAAQRVARDLGPDAVVVTIICDSGQRYLTTPTFSTGEAA